MTPHPDSGEPEEKAPFLVKLVLTLFPFALLALLLGLDRCGAPWG